VEAKAQQTCTSLLAGLAESGTESGIDAEKSCLWLAGTVLEEMVSSIRR
jgi:hypothetical protein